MIPRTPILIPFLTFPLLFSAFSSFRSPVLLFVCVCVFFYFIGKVQVGMTHVLGYFNEIRPFIVYLLCS